MKMMSDLRQAAQQALEALEEIADEVFSAYDNELGDAILALRAALAEPEQEPVAWRWKERINSDFDSWVITSSEPPPYAVEKQPLYTAPPQRKPLTDEQISRIWGSYLSRGLEFARAIEAAHGIKENT
jgi:hypothetical protein